MKRISELKEEIANLKEEFNCLDKEIRSRKFPNAIKWEKKFLDLTKKINKGENKDEPK